MHWLLSRRKQGRLRRSAIGELRCSRCSYRDSRSRQSLLEGSWVLVSFRRLAGKNVSENGGRGKYILALFCVSAVFHAFRLIIPWQKLPPLWQVVPERGQEHVLRRTGVAQEVPCDRVASCSCPRVADDVGVLRSPLDSSFGAVVEAIPEAQGALDQRTGVPVAV